MNDTVLIAIIGALAVLAAAFINGYFNLKVKHSQVKNKVKEVQDENIRLKIELSCVNILFNHGFLKVLNSKIQNLFNQTKVNRFLILSAINGKTEFNFVSVCYEQSKGNANSDAIYMYVRLEVDEHYKSMLKEVERNGHIYLDVAAMPDCLLKDVYQSKVEGVYYSVIKFLKRLKVDSDNDIVVFSSAATTVNEPFTIDEKLVIKSCYDFIRMEASTISFENYKQ